MTTLHGIWLPAATWLAGYPPDGVTWLVLQSLGALVATVLLAWPLDWARLSVRPYWLLLPLAIASMVAGWGSLLGVAWLFLSGLLLVYLYMFLSIWLVEANRLKLVRRKNMVG